MSKGTVAKEGPGRHAKGEEPLVLVVDSSWIGVSEPKWENIEHVDPLSISFDADLKAALELKQIRGIVVQLDPKNGGCCRGLEVGEQIRKRKNGTPVIVFTSNRPDPACPKNGSGCDHYPRLHKLIRNRGSLFMQTTERTTRKDVLKVLGSIEPLTESARLNIELNYLDLHGRLTHLLEHELKSNERAEAAATDMLRLARAFSVEDQVRGIVDKAAGIRNEHGTEDARTGSLRSLTSELLSHFPAPEGNTISTAAKPLVGCHVLLIEDNDEDAKWLQDKLANEGLPIVERLTDGAKAEIVLKKKAHKAHALVSDWELLDGNKDPQVARQGFELLSLGGKEITVRIALTSMSSRTRSAIGSSLMRSGVPNMRMYRKEDLKTPAVWDCFVRDIEDSVQWSKRIIQERLEHLGLGMGDFELWQEYFMTIEGEAGKRREQEVSKAASAWWKGLLEDLTRTCNNEKPIKDLQVSGSNSFQGQTGVRGSLEFMLIVRRVTFAALIWLRERNGPLNLDQILEAFVPSSTTPAFGSSSDAKGFKSRHSIKTEQLQVGKGLLNEERTWLEEKMPQFSFVSAVPGKP